VTGSQALSVHDPYASDVTFERGRQKRPKRFLRFRYRHSVEVDLGLDPVLATAQLPQYAGLYAISREHKLFAARKLRIAGVGVQTLLENGMPVGPSETRARRRPARLHGRNIARQRLHVPHRLAKQVGIVLGRFPIQATSAERRQNSIVTRLLLAPAPGHSTAMHLKTLTA
jgi:hypothetical protein